MSDQTKQARQSIGKQIKAERTRQKLIQYDLCMLTGISLRTLKRIEKGDANYLIDHVTNICQKLGIDNLKIENDDKN